MVFVLALAAAGFRYLPRPRWASGPSAQRFALVAAAPWRRRGRSEPGERVVSAVAHLGPKGGQVIEPVPTPYRASVRAICALRPARGCGVPRPERGARSFYAGFGSAVVDPFTAQPGEKFLPFVRRTNIGVVVFEPHLLLLAPMARRSGRPGAVRGEGERVVPRVSGGGASRLPHRGAPRSAPTGAVTSHSRLAIFCSFSDTSCIAVPLSKRHLPKQRQPLAVLRMLTWEACGVAPHPPCREARLRRPLPAGAGRGVVFRLLVKQLAPLSRSRRRGPHPPRPAPWPMRACCAFAQYAVHGLGERSTNAALAAEAGEGRRYADLKRAFQHSNGRSHRRRTPFRGTTRSRSARSPSRSQ